VSGLRLAWPQRSDYADDLPGRRAARYGPVVAGPGGQRVGIGVLWALRPGRRAPGGGKLDRGEQLLLLMEGPAAM
jgi:hypothetical protein